jgi:hypothetical protein
VIIKDHKRFGMATEPTEPKRTYVQPNRFGVAPDQSPPDAPLKPGKRFKILEVRGRLEVVEFV